MITWYSEYPGYPPGLFAVNTNLYRMSGASTPGRETRVTDESLVLINCSMSEISTHWPEDSFEELLFSVLKMDHWYVRVSSCEQPSQLPCRAIRLDGFNLMSQLSTHLKQGKGSHCVMLVEGTQVICCITYGALSPTFSVTMNSQKRIGFNGIVKIIVDIFFSEL